MNGVMGMTELALDTDLTPDQRGYLEIVRSSADALLGIINDILDFSKIEARKLELDLMHFDLPGALDETVRLLAPRAHQKGLELVCDIGADVPTTVVGDPGRVRQIVVNMVANAVKFTEAGEVVLRLQRESIDGNRQLVHFTVTDTGIGIPLEKQASIFEAFTQADSSMTRRFGGTGLGLAITSQLVGLMGGRIWVTSEPGTGSVFHFTIPFEVPANSLVAPPAVAAANLHGLSVLVVDDNATNRRILHGMLTRWHMRPTLVDSGRAALEAVDEASRKGKPFSIALLDFQMPEMDGFELAGLIKQRPDLAATTIMMLSSVGQRGDSLRCKELGVAAYLTKPAPAGIPIIWTIENGEILSGQGTDKITFKAGAQGKDITIVCKYDYGNNDCLTSAPALPKPHVWGIPAVPAISLAKSEIKVGEAVGFTVTTDMNIEAWGFYTTTAIEAQEITLGSCFEIGPLTNGCNATYTNKTGPGVKTMTFAVSAGCIRPSILARFVMAPRRSRR